MAKEGFSLGVLLVAKEPQDLKNCWKVIPERTPCARACICVSDA